MVRHLFRFSRNDWMNIYYWPSNLIFLLLFKCGHWCDFIMAYLTSTLLSFFVILQSFSIQNLPNSSLHFNTLTQIHALTARASTCTYNIVTSRHMHSTQVHTNTYSYTHAHTHLHKHVHPHTSHRQATTRL